MKEDKGSELAVRGHDFELGAPLSGGAGANLDAAVQMLISRFSAADYRLTGNGAGCD